MRDGKLIFKMKEGDEEWTRIDDGGPGKLGGCMGYHGSR